MWLDHQGQDFKESSLSGQVNFCLEQVEQFGFVSRPSEWSPNIRHIGQTFFGNSAMKELRRIADQQDIGQSGNDNVSIRFILVDSAINGGGVLTTGLRENGWSRVEARMRQP